MTQSRHTLGAPFDWCDRRCERCPLENDCLLATRLGQVAFLKNAIADDLTGWEPELAKVWSALDGALFHAGVDPRSPHAHLAPPSRPMPRISPAQRPLIDAMDHYYLAAFELYSRAPAEYEPQVRQCANRAVLIVQKMLRVAALLPDTLLGPLRSKDERLYGNLLLVDALEQEQSPAVLALARQIGAHTSDFEEAREHFRPALDALLSALPRGTRAQVKKLVLGRGAPSPFVVVERPEPPVCGCGARHPRAHPP